MIEVERLSDWLGQDVFGSDGEKAGKLDEVFLDGPDPVLAEVKGSGLRRRTHLVPLDGAVVGRDYLRVSHSAKLVTGAPGSSGDGAPDETTLHAVAEHYGLRLRGQGVLEGSKARAGRLAAAAEAEQRAHELEDEARRQEQAAADNTRASEEAAVARRRAAEDAERARAEAERARQGG